MKTAFVDCIDELQHHILYLDPDVVGRVRHEVCDRVGVDGALRLDRHGLAVLALRPLDVVVGDGVAVRHGRRPADQQRVGGRVAQLHGGDRAGGHGLGSGLEEMERG